MKSLVVAQRFQKGEFRTGRVVAEIVDRPRSPAASKAGERSRSDEPAAPVTRTDMAKGLRLEISCRKSRGRTLTSFVRDGTLKRGDWPARRGRGKRL